MVLEKVKCLVLRLRPVLIYWEESQCVSHTWTYPWVHLSFLGDVGKGFSQYLYLLVEGESLRRHFVSKVQRIFRSSTFAASDFTFITGILFRRSFVLPSKTLLLLVTLRVNCSTSPPGFHKTPTPMNSLDDTQVIPIGLSLVLHKPIGTQKVLFAHYLY